MCLQGRRFILDWQLSHSLGKSDLLTLLCVGSESHQLENSIAALAKRANVIWKWHMGSSISLTNERSFDPRAGVWHSKRRFTHPAKAKSGEKGQRFARRLRRECESRILNCRSHEQEKHLLASLSALSATFWYKRRVHGTFFHFFVGLFLRLMLTARVFYLASNERDLDLIKVRELAGIEALCAIW